MNICSNDPNDIYDETTEIDKVRTLLLVVNHSEFVGVVRFVRPKEEKNGGARSGTRTRTDKPRDFKSLVSAIPPSGRAV